MFLNSSLQTGTFILCKPISNVEDLTFLGQVDHHWSYAMRCYMLLWEGAVIPSPVPGYGLGDML